jgi:hypothetical protein
MYSCTRFHHYTYGRHVTVHSDHKPIAVIIKKLLSAASPRLHRMLLHLQKYDITVIHVPGKNILVSDRLFRQCISDSLLEVFQELDTHVQTVCKQLHFTDQRLQLSQK